MLSTQNTHKYKIQDIWDLEGADIDVNDIASTRCPRRSTLKWMKIFTGLYLHITFTLKDMRTWPKMFEGAWELESQRLGI